MDPIMEAKVRKIYQWCSQRTSETTEYERKYLWPDGADSLLRSLKLSEGSINALVGLSGVGKSSALRQISLELEKSERQVLCFKWPGGLEPYRELMEYVPVISEISDFLLEEIQERAVQDPKRSAKLESMLGAPDPDRQLTVGDLEQFRKKYDTSPEALWSFFNVGEKKVLMAKYVVQAFSKYHSILIDLRDYDRGNKGMMTNDLAGVQKLWQSLNEFWQISDKPMPNFVFVLQKELAYDKGIIDNFFVRKARAFEIKPFTTDELVDAFRDEFDDPSPFTDDALQYAASLSRGVFRRFLRYLQLCLEEFIDLDPQSLDLPLAQRAITSEEIEKDWALELQELFPHGEKWKTAFRLMMHVVNHGPTIQKELASTLQVSEAEVTKILQSLEEHGYVKREQTEKGKLVHAAQ
jgi:biotin operon repressor